jgi:tetratricopeptide (TPR) repeat protein
MKKVLPSLVCTLLLATAGCTTVDHDRWRMLNDDGVSLFAKGAYDDALENFDYALTLHADDPVIYYNMAQCHERLGHARQAEQYYAACLQRDPKHGDARLAIITMKYRSGSVVEANQMIRDWLTQDPKSADPLVADAWRLRQERNYPLAQGRLQEALSREIDNRRALTELAILDEVQNMPDRALVHYDRILVKEPNQVEIRERLELLKTKGVKRPTPN